MQKRLVFPGLVFFFVLANLFGFKTAGAAAGRTLVLYDAASGAIPDPLLLSFNDFPPGAAPPTFIEGATVLDTAQAGRKTFAGWVASQATIAGFPILDPGAGIQVNFTLQVENESHSNPNRAGFSVILLDQHARGIELAFWENKIWAQNDDKTGGLFTHGEEASWRTTTGQTDYQLNISADTYTLFANSESILSGPVRDYSTFEGFPDPYETQNFIFLGDDTTSSQARVRLRFVSIAGTEPVQPTTTITSTSTSSPLPTASLTPIPTASPIPSPTPAPSGKPFALCPSGWIILAMLLTNLIVIKNIRR